MDDNTFKAIDRLCDLAEYQIGDGDYTGRTVTLKIIEDLISKVDPNKHIEQHTGAEVV